MQIIKLKGILFGALLLFLASGLGEQAFATQPPISVWGPSPPSSGEVEYVPGEIVVKFKPRVNDAAIASINSRYGTSVLETSSYSGFKLINVPTDKTVPEMVELYIQDPDVEYAEPNYIRHAHWAPNDEYYSLQWHLDNEDYGGINTEAAWDIETGDSSVVVAVIDTGVAYEDYDGYYLAPDLAATSFVAGYDFVNDDSHPNDDESHGTHVTGTIAQSTNNTTGVAGVAFNCSIMPIKVLNEYGSGSDDDIADGIMWAADNGADVINMSLGGPGSSTTLENACAYAYNQGVTIVCSSGNDGVPSVGYPAAHDDYCIAVGANRYDEAVTYYSNWGSSLDLVAPGGQVYIEGTTQMLDQNGDGYPDGVLQQTFDPITQDPSDFSYWFFDGTSMAAPHVSGVAALLISSGTATSPDDVREALESTAEDHGATGWDPVYGWGIVDAYAALMWTPAPFAFEVGEVSLNHNWTTVNLTQSFTDPVVVAKPLSYNGGHPATVRIRNVTSTSFDIMIQEWPYLDRWHLTEQISYMVMERGHFSLNGAYVEAGTIDTNATGWPSVWVPFSSEFGNTPVVVSSVMSINGIDTVVTRNTNVTTTGFKVVMQEQQSNTQLHLPETISYIACEPGSGTVGGWEYEVGTEEAVNHGWSTISYGPFGNVPIVLMDVQTVNGPDPCNLRYVNKDADSVDVKVDEEQSADPEKWHITETVGYFAFGSAQGVKVNIDTPDEVAEGTGFIVTLNITNVDPAVAIAGVQFDISFDPSLITANSVTEGNLLNQSCPAFFQPGTIDNGAGTITGVYGVVLGQGCSVSGSGTFATITFTAGTTAGTSDLDLYNSVVSDIDGVPLSITVNDGTVTVS